MTVESCFSGRLSDLLYLSIESHHKLSFNKRFKALADSNIAMGNPDIWRGLTNTLAPCQVHQLQLGPEQIL